MNARMNVARVVTGMKAKRWNVRQTCVNCGINSKTLKKILDGQVPARLDALYRLADGLGIAIEEVILNAAPHKTAMGQRLSLVSGGRALSKIHEDDEEGAGPSAA
jgi:transcriptional regulator with XRE-family HTH domain